MNRVQPDAAPADLTLRRSFLAALGLALSPAGLRWTRADDDAASPEGAADRLKAMEKVVRSVSISELAEGASTVPLAIHAEPLFRYNNPTRRVYDGTLWSLGRSGRPAALLKVVLNGVKPRVSEPAT